MNRRKKAIKQHIIHHPMIIDNLTTCQQGLNWHGVSLIIKQLKSQDGKEPEVCQ
jgi:hypothetical protein